MSATHKAPQIDAVCTGNTIERGCAQGQAMAETIRESATVRVAGSHSRV